MKLRNILIFGFALTSLFSSCDKENQDIKFSGILEPTNSKIALNPTSGRLAWEQNDQVWITGFGGTAMGGNFTISGIDQNRAYFTKDNNNNGFSGNSNFITISPLSSVVQEGSWINYSSNHPFFKATLPTEQNPNVSGYDPRTLIITAQAQKQNNTVQFQYHNAVAYLCFTLNSSATNVAYVEVSSDKSNQLRDAYFGRLVGIAPVYAIYGYSDLYSWEDSYDTEANHKVTFRNNNSTALSTGTNYYVAIWPGNWVSGGETTTQTINMNNYKTNLTIKAYDSNGNQVGKGLIASGAKQFFRNTIYSVGEIGGPVSKNGKLLEEIQF